MGSDASATRKRSCPSVSARRRTIVSKSKLTGAWGEKQERHAGKPEGGTYDEKKAAWEQRVAAAKAAIAARAQLLCDMYIALIKLGEVSIRSEYFFRKRGDFQMP